MRVTADDRESWIEHLWKIIDAHEEANPKYYEENGEEAEDTRGIMAWLREDLGLPCELEKQNKKRIEMIKNAIDNGFNVTTRNGAYSVVKGKTGEYYIKYNGEPDNFVGLHGQTGTEYQYQLNVRDLIIHVN